jgi:hypothetical protein
VRLLDKKLLDVLVDTAIPTRTRIEGVEQLFSSIEPNVDGFGYIAPPRRLITGISYAGALSFHNVES